MHTIAELNMLLRTQTELPDGLKMATDEFCEGWNFVRSLDAPSLQKAILRRGWSFVRIADASLRSGVGETSQEAIASALKLALRRISTDFNAVEVEHIELTQYPWFYLARIRVYPYRIQESAAVHIPEETMPLPANSRNRLLPTNAAVLYPHFGSAMPQLKQMLILSRGSQAGAQ
jgi:hypothetical protein